MNSFLEKKTPLKGNIAYALENSEAVPIRRRQRVKVKHTQGSDRSLAPPHKSEFP